MMNPWDIFTYFDDIQYQLKIILAVSDLLSCMNNDPPLENTIQETGALLLAKTQKCIGLLENIHASCHTIIQEEYPNANLPNPKRTKK
jgi:hypothetical protein